MTEAVKEIPKKAEPDQVVPPSKSVVENPLPTEAQLFAAFQAGMRVTPNDVTVAQVRAGVRTDDPTVAQRLVFDRWRRGEL